ncbi:MAG TPA: DUF2249 domain-containing protein [Longimicrobiales bacterium]
MSRPATGPVRPTDRVASVLARDERLVDVFVGLSGAFERLRRPAMRKTMARLVTIEQAAKMAGIPVDSLVARLNEALGAPGDDSGPEVRAHAPDAAGTPERRASGPPADPKPRAATADAVQVPTGVAAAVAAAPGAKPDAGPAAAPDGPDRASTAGPPPALAALPAERIVDLDVRDDLRRGQEPFSRIMAARRELPPGGVLRLRAIFEPVPLYAVMAKQGFDHWTEQFAEDDWRVWFYPAAGATPDRAEPPHAAVSAPASTGAGGDSSGAAASADTGADGDDDVVVLDVRGLEPPEPMVRTLEALETLPAGATLLQINVRVPRFLLPQLEARGFTYEIREQSKDLVRVFIRRRAEDRPPPGGS